MWDPYTLYNYTNAKMKNQLLHKVFYFQKQRLEKIKTDSERLQQELSRLGEELSIAKRLVRYSRQSSCRR